MAPVTPVGAVEAVGATCSGFMYVAFSQAPGLAGATWGVPVIPGPVPVGPS